MKIAYLINTYPRPSHTFIRREIRALERLGFSVHRFAMRSDRISLTDPEDKAEDLRTEHVLDIGGAALAFSALKWLATHPLRSLRALSVTFRLARNAHTWIKHLIYLAEAAHVATRCRELEIRHIHAHFGTNPATIATLCKVLGGPGFSITIHGPEEFDAPRTLSLGEKVAHSRFSVAVSSFGRSQLYRWSAIENWPRLKVIHCGVEPQYFAAPLSLPVKRRMVAIGRFTEQKGFPLLVEAMAEAVRKAPELRLTLIGDGELRGEIEAEIERRTLRRHIELTGWLAEDAIREELKSAQVLILPSFAEGLPMVVMEAMATGRPVISTAIAGIPELVTPETGWLVPAGDSSALAKAMVELAATPHDKLVAMGKAGHARVLERHDVNREAEKLAALIRNTAHG